MPVLFPRSPFPPASEADDEGLLAVGGDYEPELLLDAYTQGIFPWPSPGVPCLWFSPDPRAVLPLERFHVSRRLRRTLRQRRFEVTFDRAFEAVVRACSEAPRPGQGGTWIVPEMIPGYATLHRWGVAHSVEAWRDGELVGGVYGVAVGTVFCGESMFHRVSDASKVALASLVARARDWGFDLLDAQVMTEHVRRAGAESWPRERFLAALADAVRRPWRIGDWADPDLAPTPASGVARRLAH